MVDAVQLLFYGADGNIYGVVAPTSGNGGLPVTPVSSGGGPAPFDLEQIKGVAVVTAGLAGLLAVGGPAASGAALSGNPVLIGVSDGVDVRTLMAPGGVGDGNTLVAGLAVGNYGWNNTSWDKFRTLPGLAITGLGLQAAGVAAVFNTTPPTYPNGAYGALQMTARGSLASTIFDPANNRGAVVSTPGADALTPVNTLFVTPQGPLIYNGTGSGGSSQYDQVRTINGAVIAGTGNTAINEAPTSAAPAAIAPTATTVAASSLTLKSSAGNHYSFNGLGTIAGYFMLFDAPTPPADGTVTPKKVYAVAAGASLDVEFTPPLRMATGGTWVFSITGPFTKTASATAFMSGEMV